MSVFSSAQIEQVRASVDLQDFASRYTTLKRESGREYSGPCPICKAGTDRFHVDTHTQRWMCSYCTGRESWNDVIELQRLLAGVDFVHAVEALGGRADMVQPVSQPLAPRTNDDERWKDQRTQERMLRVLNEAADRLDRDAGNDGRAYLQQRGISLHTAHVWILGYAPVSPPWNADLQQRTGAASITLPYLRAKDDAIMAVRYRRLNNTDDRYINEPGSSMQHLYGMHLLDLNAPALFVVEGELNAISIWQVSRDIRLCVVSTGSQTIGPVKLREIAHLSGRYDHCVVWCDEAEKSQQLRAAATSPHVQMRRSPKVDGVKVDANDMLQQGVLGPFLSRIMEGVTA